MAALSVINFRMKQTSKVAPAAEKVEQILFSGNGIKLIELKKEIAEKKKFSNNLDYDLTVTDENGKEFLDDDEVVPKNASVVVKRLPAKNNGGLISRLKRREAQPHLKSSTIEMPMKAEPSTEEDDIFNLL
eukprot:gene28073-36964_t